MIIEIAIGVIAGVVAEVTYISGRAFVVCFRYAADLQRLVGRTLTRAERRALVKHLQARREI